MEKNCSEPSLEWPANKKENEQKVHPWESSKAKTQLS